MNFRGKGAVKIMVVSYKRLWKLLIDKDMKKKDLKDSIVKIILNLKDTYKDLEAHDICIIFNDISMYDFVPILEEEIYSKTKFE